jgi:hypothetical protein
MNWPRNEKIAAKATGRDLSSSSSRSRLSTQTPSPFRPPRSPSRRLPAAADGRLEAQVQALPRQGPRGAPAQEVAGVQAGLRRSRGARRRRRGRGRVGRRGQRREELRCVRGRRQPQSPRRALPRHAATRPERGAAGARRRRRARSRTRVRAGRHW